MSASPLSPNQPLTIRTRNSPPRTCLLYTSYKSASDAAAWNDNYVAEKGVGVANDGSIGATGATGAFPYDRGCLLYTSNLNINPAMFALSARNMSVTRLLYFCMASQLESPLADVGCLLYTSHHICPNKKKNYKKYRELIIYTIVFFKVATFIFFQ